MKTMHVTDYFAPLPSYTRFGESQTVLVQRPLKFMPRKTGKMLWDRIPGLDPADRFTYIIMGLAILIAIVVPLLNLAN